MNPQLFTAPGRIDLYVSGERFASYDFQGGLPGFTELLAGGLRPVTQAGSAGLALWIMHGSVAGAAFGTSEHGSGRVGTIAGRDLLVRRGSQSVGFQHECDWIGPDGSVVMRDTRTVRVANGPASGAILDLNIRLSAPDAEPIQLGVAESALVCLRPAQNLLPPGGGQLRNSSDEFGAAVHGRKAAWVACTGVVLGETVGLAMLDHPENPWHPPTWNAREDGILSPSPFAWSAHRIAGNGSLALRYRIIVHSGYVEASWVRERMRDWLRE